MNGSACHDNKHRVTVHLAIAVGGKPDFATACGRRLTPEWVIGRQEDAWVVNCTHCKRAIEKSKPQESASAKSASTEEPLLSARGNKPGTWAYSMEMMARLLEASEFYVEGLKSDAESEADVANGEEAELDIALLEEIDYFEEAITGGQEYLNKIQGQY